MDDSKNQTKIENQNSSDEKMTLKVKIKNALISALASIKSSIPIFLSQIKEKVSDFKNGYRNWYFKFAKFSLLKKLSFLGFTVFFFASLGFLYKIVTVGLFTQEEDVFISSLEAWSQEKQLFDPKTQMESFFESTRTSQNIFMIKKLMVNIRASNNSGPNPMGAFEFLAEGAANDVVVELKDREPEILDLFSRTIEEMTYDQLNTAEGKKSLCDRLRREVNSILTTGFVRRVFLKTIVIKP